MNGVKACCVLPSADPPLSQVRAKTSANASGSADRSTGQSVRRQLKPSARMIVLGAADSTAGSRPSWAMVFETSTLSSASRRDRPCRSSRPGSFQLLAPAWRSKAISLAGRQKRLCGGSGRGTQKLRSTEPSRWRSRELWRQPISQQPDLLAEALDAWVAGGRVPAARFEDAGAAWFNEDERIAALISLACRSRTLARYLRAAFSRPKS